MTNRRNFLKQLSAQIPIRNNHSCDINMKVTGEHCKKIIHLTRLFGFMTVPWRPTLKICLDTHKEATKQVGDIISKNNNVR